MEINRIISEDLENCKI